MTLDTHCSEILVQLRCLQLLLNWTDLSISEELHNALQARIIEKIEDGNNIKKIWKTFRGTE